MGNNYCIKWHKLTDDGFLDPRWFAMVNHGEHKSEVVEKGVVMLEGKNIHIVY